MASPYHNRIAARIFLDAYARTIEVRGSAFACEHGHFNCSNMNRGACLDEVLSAFPDLDEDDWNEPRGGNC